MSITDELRECIKTANRSYEDTRNPYNDREVLHIVDEELLAIADRIDAAHEAALLNVRTDLMDASGWARLPKDADGEYIHIGDYVETLIEAFKGQRGRVECLTLTEDGWCVDGDAPSTVRHVKPDSWESIIHDATGAGWMGESVFDEKDFERIEAELVERCKRLAGE